MKFSYNWLKEYVDTNASAQKVAEVLTMHSFEVEEVLKDSDDYIFNIDILPNRLADAASHLGVARELAVLFNKPLKEPQPKFKEDKHIRTDSLAKVSVLNKDLAPRYSARVVLGVKVGESPTWLKKRLRAVGVGPINNMVDAANYVMLELGQPLHVFDLAKIAGETIVVRSAKKGEELKTLDGKHIKLRVEDLVIADSQRPLALAGIKGGEDSGVSRKTKNILLESANFSRAGIRSTAQYHHLRTDASLRFGAGLSPHLTTIALDRLCELILNISGGRVPSGILDVKAKLPTKRAVAFLPEEVGDFLGVKITSKEITDILTGLGFKVSKSAKKILVVVPDSRVDVERKEDVFEEVGRIFGYDKIAPMPLTIQIRPLIINEEITFRANLKNMLASLGFYEVINYVLVANGSVGESPWRVEKAISSERGTLRTSLTEGILANIANAQRFEENSGFFEIGKTYHLRKGQPDEEWRLAISLSEKKPETAHQTFYILKGRVERLLEQNSIFGVWFDEALSQKDIPQVFNPAKSAILRTEDNQTIGFLGEIDPSLQDKYNIEGRVALALFSLGTLQSLALEDRFYRSLPKFPPIKRDIAFLVPRYTRVQEIENVIYNARSKYLIDVDLFDVYEDLQDTHFKSLAFHLIFQSDEKTLTKKDIEGEEKRIKKALEEKLDAQIR